MDIVAVVLMASGTHHEVSQLTVDKIYESANGDKVRLDDGSWITVGNQITEIMPIAEYRRQFPDRVPQNYGQPYTQLPPARGNEQIINAAPEAGVKAMMRGLARFLEANPNSPNAKRLYAKMQERLNYLNKQNGTN